MSSEIPRRSRIDLFVPAEKAIWDAAQAVEALPPDVRLTHAGNKLQEARALVADFVDGTCSTLPMRRCVTTCLGFGGSLIGHWRARWQRLP